MTKKLYVGNLSYATTESNLSELFGAMGEVSSVSLITDRSSGRSKGFAFVEMAEDSVAQEAIAQLNNKELDGRQISVAEARPQKPRSNQYSGGHREYGGGGGNRGRGGRNRSY
ncbi:MAG: RNA recognition motif domain-containing protein [Anaerolineae bacterium]|jgi:cold-inducible RNA-binding protein